MEKSGVEFVIQGLESFVAGMQRANSATRSMGTAMRALEIAGNVAAKITQLGAALIPVAPQIGLIVGAIGLFIQGLVEVGKMAGGVVGRAIEGLGRALQGLYNTFANIIRPITAFVSNLINAINPIRMFTDLLDRIAYISLGILTAQAVRAISGMIVDLGKSAFDAATQFQLLHLRLTGLLARDVIQSLTDVQLETANFGQIMADAAAPAKELFEWIRKIAITTPFTVETLSNTFTMAKAYGLATDTAKNLVVATGNFVAGMGLEDTVMKRVIENIGQMIQQSKVTGTELRDLARGAYVPTTEVLGVMAKKYGVTTEAMRNMVKTATGPEGKKFVEEFLQAFILVSNRDFPGAMERMSMTIPGILSNLRDFVQAILGFSVLGPAVDTLASKLGHLFVDILGDPRVLDMADSIGKGLQAWVEGLWPKDLTAKTIMDKVYEGFLKLQKAVGFLQSGSWKNALKTLGVPQWVIDSVDNLVLAFKGMQKFWKEHGDDIVRIVGEVADALGFKDFKASDTILAITEDIQDFSLWLVDHGPEVVTNIENIAKSIEHFATVTIPLLTGQLPALEGTGTSVELMLTPLDKLAVTLNKLYDVGKRMADAFLTVVVPAFDSMSRALDGMGVSIGDVNPLLAIFVELVNVGLAIAAGIINGLATAINNLKDAFDEIALGFALIETGFTKLSKLDFSGIQDIFNGIYDIIVGVFTATFGTVLSLIGGFIDGVIKYFQDLSDDLVGNSIIPDMMDSISDAFENGLSAVTGIIQTAIDQWVAEFTSKYALAYSLGLNFASKIKQGIVDKLREALKQVQNLVAQILAAVARLMGLGIPGLGSAPKAGGDTGTTCFVAGTPIEMADGTFMPIEYVVVGDHILSYDTLDGTKIHARVESVFHHAPDESPSHLILNGIRITPNHLMYLHGGLWREAGKIRIGDELMDRDGKAVKVKTLVTVNMPASTYNFHTDHLTHNYFAGGVLAHNAKPGEGLQEGGISTGPESGHMELLHGTEAVIPLAGGKIPVELAGINKLVESMTNVMVSSMQRFMAISMQQMSMVALRPGMSGNTYNIDVNANYSNPQSPVTISHDLEALLARTRA